MGHQTHAPGGLDYRACRYGASRLSFRGPARDLGGNYIAFLGGTTTFGRFIDRPFPTLTEQYLGQSCVNFGCVNAGIDAFVQDTAVIDAAARSDLTVIEVTGAQSLSNRHYSVHPRHNDRFLRASDLLRALYPEVDFTEFHFVRHMLGALQEICPDRFAVVREELQVAWVARMKQVIARLGGNVVLLWFSGRGLTDDEAVISGGEPLFISRAMIEALRSRVRSVVEVTPSGAAQAIGTQGMVYTEFEEAAARETLGPLAHEEAAAALVQQILPMLRRRAG